uniref:RxLR effector protein n=1 Tax=Phytophthora sojae TaxID=67593 RepID=G1AS86_PHYSO|nr:putative RxLR effector protein [Phytophthora sojae]UEE94953.1 RxLR effector protein [Phytophthora sojae]UYW66147.1 RxLR effector protein [Phytophthora sojae]
MRLVQVVVVTAASFLVATDALSTTNANQAKIIKGTSPGGHSPRLLRAYQPDDEGDSPEERTLPNSQVAKILNKLGVTWDDVLRDSALFERYQEKANKIIEKQKAAANNAKRIIKRDHTP